MRRLLTVHRSSGSKQRIVHGSSDSDWEEGEHRIATCSTTLAFPLSFLLKLQLHNPFVSLQQTQESRESRQPP